ncbi:MAG: hypothetical protein ACLQVL_21260 [Terriglobia bacterium]
MNEPSTTSIDIKRLIFVPALVTLAVTAARLAGELAHGPRRLFNSDPGGSWAIVGIIWLAPIFGIYFALKLAANGHGPKSLFRAVGFAFLGVAVVFTFSFVGALLHLQQHFWGRLLYFWTLVAVAALVTLPGWRDLFRTLLAYAYAARVPVAVVMLLAFWRDWGTHYDAVPADLPEGLTLTTKYLWLGFFPQLILWVGATVLAGMLFGSLAAAIARLPRHKRQTL